jgi:hypothetical protein
MVVAFKFGGYCYCYETTSITKAAANASTDVANFNQKSGFAIEITVDQEGRRFFR